MSFSGKYLHLQWMMKCAMVFLLTVLECTSNAQVMISAEGGLCTNTFSDKTNYSCFAPLLGMGIKYDLPKTFSIEGRVLYQTKGFIDYNYYVEYFSGKKYATEAVHNFQYLSIPILLRTDFGNRGHFFFHVGPSFNYLISDKYNLVHSDRIAPQSNPVLPNSYNKRDVDMLVGFGMQFHLKDKLFLSWEARICGAIFDISNQGQLYLTSNYILLNLGYQL